ncbi:MAG: UDP-4-amino-4,6-dideoxy-N-acetyl-beta-L-altrosamine transaminase [Cyclobacteriaceae bacterium]|nr:UDP-4-amino-4,6-dideoxy-N-acetyl-beta-L-altrosamine transaminase [Cyclobacteriaceae bacterium]
MAIPYGRQWISDEDIEAVVSVLKSDFLTQGPEIPRLEQSFANYTSSHHAVAVSNGTAALHLCCMALDLKAGDSVITTPITFAATANCARYVGAEVIFADIDPETWLLDIQKVEDILKNNRKNRIKGIIPVDFAGRAVNMEEFREIANRYDLWLLEDACHAPGGYFTDSNGLQHNCGSGTFADLAIFSFHPVKHIAAGEGGMVTSRNKKLYERMLHLRTHGISKDQNCFQNPVEIALGVFEESSLNEEISDRLVTSSNSMGKNYPGWYMEMQELGYNYRLTDFQAALASSQLKRAADNLQKRREIAARYYRAFEGMEFICRQAGVVDGHAYHLYIIEVTDRIGLYNYLRSKNIFAQVHYIPVHLMPYYRQFGWQAGDFPNAEKYYSHCLSLPMYPTLSVSEQDYVIESVLSYYTR